MKDVEENKLKIYKIFYDAEVIEKCPGYEFLFSEKEGYPYYNRLANYSAHDCSTKYISNVSKSVERFLNENLDDIDGLFIKLDIEAMIMSAILTRLNNKKFHYPSFESIFICHHKYYQRKSEKNPIKYSHIDIDDDLNQINWNELPTFPFFFKAPELQMSVHQYVIENRNQLFQTIEKLQIDLPNYNVDTKFLNGTYLNLDKYPLATKNLMLCEQFMKNCFQLNWEGWADQQGNVFTYGFTDEILADYGIFSDFIMPSKLPHSALEKCEQICFEFLKTISFKNSFANIELWIDKSDYSQIHIIEVNPRSAFPYHQQYQTSFHGTNLYHSIIQLSMGHQNIGITPDIDQNFTGLYSCQSVFATRLNGFIDQLLDFEQIDREKSIHKDYIFFFLFQNRKFQIIDNYQSGARVLMRVFFTKPTYQQTLDESLRLKKLFLIRDDYFL